MRLSRREFERLSRQVVKELPRQVLAWVDNLDIVVQDWPTPEQLEEAGMEDRGDLLGLYQGVPLAEREGGNPELPDKVILFQGPVESLGRTRKEVKAEIKATILHELAHHLGISEERLEELGIT